VGPTPHDPDVTDLDLQSEIELLADLIDVAADARRPLTDDELDAALGIRPPCRELEVS
jgi:hypothetical protein